MKKVAFFALIIISISIRNALAGLPSFPLILETIPEQPSLTATLQLTDGTTLKDVFILSHNVDSDPGDVTIRFFRSPLKSSVYLRDIKTLEFEKNEGEKGIYPGDNINISLKNGNKASVEYLGGLNDGLIIVYKDNFSGYFQKLYIPIYKKVSDKSDMKKLYVKQVVFSSQAPKQVALKRNLKKQQKPPGSKVEEKLPETKVQLKTPVEVAPSPEKQGALHAKVKPN